MTSDSYKIIISISHRRIAFEYWQRDGGDKLVAMPPAIWPAPLAFYCSSEGIEIGDTAERAARRGTSNAFDNYFDQLREDKYYTLGSQRKPIANLLLDAAEFVFRDFFRNILFNRAESLIDNRANMPLTIVCESDITDNERAFLASLFRDNGYEKSKVVDYERYVRQFVNENLSREYDVNKALVAWTEGEDLSLTLFDLKSENAGEKTILKGLGIDPRIDIVKNKIWEDIIGQIRWVDRKNEETIIADIAADFINSAEPFVTKWLTLSDGETECSISLNRNFIDLLQCDESKEIKHNLNNFLLKNGVVDRREVLLLLRGATANNTYFIENLNCAFAHVVKSDKKLRENTMRLLIADNEECRQTIATEPRPQEPSVSSTISLKRFERKWRELRAEIVGKQKDTAIAILDDFVEEIPKSRDFEDLTTKIKAKIAEIKSATKQRTSKVSSSMPPARPSGTVSQQKKTTRSPEVDSTDKGKNLINKGLLKEARDWYRQKGDFDKANALSEIIRSQKGIKQRELSLNSCKKNISKNQIDRIISEIEDYIALLKKTGIDANEYIKLLNEYRKIKI